MGTVSSYEKMFFVNSSHVQEQFDAKFLEYGQIKKLKKMEIDVLIDDKQEIKAFLRKTIPHLSIVEDWEQDTFFPLAVPYAKFSPQLGFWEISCKPISLF